MNNSISELGDKISGAINRRVAKEACARRGKWQDGCFTCGNATYPAKIAVDVPLYNGAKVWAQLTPDGKAVVIGA